MSIRIHALAKELNVSNKELIDFINEHKETYNLEIKTPSNAIAPLYAEAIKSDFAKAKANAGENATPEVAEEQEEKPQEAPASAEEPTPEPVDAPAELAEPKAEEKQEEPKVEEVKPQAKSPAPAVPPIPQAKRPAPLQMPSMAKRPAPAVPPTSAKPAPVVPPAPRARISMPAVKEQPTAEKQETSKQPEVVVKMNTPSVKMPPLPPRMTPPPIPARRAPAAVVPPSAPAQNATPEVANTEKKVIVIKPPIIVRDFAKLIDLKPFRLISELMDMGIFASMNQSIDEPVAIKIAERHGFTLDIKHRGEQFQQQLKAEAEKKAAKKRIEEDLSNYVPRPPIVCVMGHVDHGKTTLLDSIRKTRVAAGEAGGITQHTAAYQVETPKGKITFLDTPGHAAFSKMRERGANVTDVAILVVAADDGFMPQTDEALNFAQKAGVPVVVAINKCDARGANVDRVKQQMQKRGIAPEDWGGETLCQPISALKGENIDKLLEQVLLQAEMSELRANPKGVLDGTIIESQLESGRGATATVIVKNGTLKTGDVILCGENWCKVRALIDDRGGRLKSAEPSTPAIVMGWTGAPEAGDTFKRVDNDRQARKLAEEATLERKKAEAQNNSAPKLTNIEDLMAAIEHKEKKTFKCIVKSDVSGTVEALTECLKAIKSDKVGLEVIGGSVGQITKTDVEFAATAQASIVAFNVKEENGVAAAAKHNAVQIVSHNIIYELINQVRESMKLLLDPELKENKLGAAEVRALFNVSKGGKVAGCMVTEGVIKRDKFARVFRKGKELAKGKIYDLKRFKDDVSEVRAGYECGLSMNNFDEFETGDQVECFEILEIRPDL